MSLIELHADIQSASAAEVVRALKTLARINDRPAAEVLKELAAKFPPQQP